MDFFARALRLILLRCSCPDTAALVVFTPFFLRGRTTADAVVGFTVRIPYVEHEAEGGNKIQTSTVAGNMKTFLT